jgi:glycosyltransferase involved in cell wall biosynthesis
MKREQISVVTVVYNEEARIENLLQNFRWTDDLIVVEKSSTDRTKQIALCYTDNVITVPYSDTGCEARIGVATARNEWVLFVTASDIIHPALVEKLWEIVNRNEFPYDIVSVPFVPMVFGLHGRWSPWYFPLKPWLFRKSVFSGKDTVHREISFSSKRVYKMKKNETEALFHLTHQTVDSFFERSLRYTKAETRRYNSLGEGLFQTLKEVVLATGWMTFYKFTFFKGWKGIALAFAFLSYFMMKFLYIWEHFTSTGEEKYEAMRQQMLKRWND